MIQRHNEIRDLEVELLEMVCSDVQIEPSLQPVTGETLNRGANKENGARLDVHVRGLWERQRSAFFDVSVCHPNADSCREMTPQQIYKQHETEKKRQYSSRVMEIEHGTFTPLVFTTTGGMSLPIGRTYIDQERRALRSNNIVDKNLSVVCDI